MLEAIFWIFVGLFIITAGAVVYNLIKRERREQGLFFKPLIAMNVCNIAVQICNLINLINKGEI